MTLDPHAEEALYRQLADELRAAIRRGDYAPGQRIPSERHLMETYGVSRTTVRLAVGALKAEGLISAGHGRGNFVRARPPVRLEFARFSQAQRQPGIGPWEAATQRAGVKGTTRVIAVEEQVADEELAARLEIDEGAPIIVRSRHMYAEQHLVQLYDGFYPFDIVQGTKLAQPGIIREGIYQALTNIGYPPYRATEELTAREATPNEAELMRLHGCAPVHEVVRTTRGESGRVLEVLRVVANGAALTFVYADLPLDWTTS